MDGMLYWSKARRRRTSFGERMVTLRKIFAAKAGVKTRTVFDRYNGLDRLLEPPGSFRLVSHKIYVRHMYMCTQTKRTGKFEDKRVGVVTMSIAQL